MEFELVIDGRLDTVDLADGEHSVGRAPGNEIQLPVASVSKHHAVIRVEDERVFVKDVGSTNGTDIDGTPVGQTEVELPEQATVRFAGVPLWRKIASVDSMATLLPENDIQSSTIFRPGDEVTDKARARIVDMLAELFELVASEDESEGIEQAACSFVAQWIDADRVFLLEDEGEGHGNHRQEAMDARRGSEGGARGRHDNADPLLVADQVRLGQQMRRRPGGVIANRHAPVHDPVVILQHRKPADRVQGQHLLAVMIAGHQVHHPGVVTEPGLLERNTGALPVRRGHGVESPHADIVTEMG